MVYLNSYAHHVRYELNPAYHLACKLHIEDDIQPRTPPTEVHHVRAWRVIFAVDHPGQENRNAVTVFALNKEAQTVPAHHGVGDVFLEAK